MSIEWRVLSMNCLKNLDGLVDVVYEINWLCYAMVNGFDGATQGYAFVQYNPEVAYTPFNQLTQDQVIDWVKDAMGKDAVSQNEQQAIAFAQEKAMPKIVTPPLPWI